MFRRDPETDNLSEEVGPSVEKGQRCTVERSIYCLAKSVRSQSGAQLKLTLAIQLIPRPIADSPTPLKLRVEMIHRIDSRLQG